MAVGAGSAMTGHRPAAVAAPGRQAWTWLLVAVLFLLCWQCAAAVAPWAVEVPKAWQVPLARWISAFMKWLLNEASLGAFSVRDATRFLAALVDIPYETVLGLLSSGLRLGAGSTATELAPPLSWVSVIGLFAFAGWVAGGRRLAWIVGLCFAFIALFGRWESAMVTLASIVVAVPVGVAGGLLLGIAAHRWRGVERALSPLLDLMQTIPVFAYLVPILVLFGFGPTAAIVATIIFAMPPMIRVTVVALRGVAPEIVDLGRMVGCTPRQMTWRVLVPAARDGLMVGVNQVIMLSLNMVIIASMIGAGGLGFDVLAALRRLDIGGGLEAGLAIVALAIALDRLSQAAVMPRNRVDMRIVAVALALAVAVSLAGTVIPALRTYPPALELSTGEFFASVVKWINVNFFDTLEGLKNAVLLNILVPFKRLLVGLPWLGVTLLVATAGYALGGLRLALVTAGLTVFIAVTGQWEKAMITVYLCGISVIVASMIGIPIGILASERPGLGKAVGVVIDTLQTLPSFVYLMPAVMLFRVGDFTAMLAIVAFAVVPAIRYTMHGLSRVDPRLVEAGRAMGGTQRQILTRIRLKLALPEILLGLNQTIMFALSMLVITALVGTRDLGQEVYIALTKADTGRGLVAGLAVAAIAIVADRLISAGAARSRRRLGLA